MFFLQSLSGISVQVASCTYCMQVSICIQHWRTALNLHRNFGKKNIRTSIFYGKLRFRLCNVVVLIVVSVVFVVVQTSLSGDWLSKRSKCNFNVMEGILKNHVSEIKNKTARSTLTCQTFFGCSNRHENKWSILFATKHKNKSLYDLNIYSYA